MISSPFAKVYIKESNRDITDLIESFKYDNTMDKDNCMTIIIKKEYVVESADDDDIVSGTLLSCQFGFLGEAISPVHVVKITDVKVSYGERVTMSVKCLDKGQDMKKGTPSKMYKGKKASDIAIDIAKKYDLTPIVTETSKSYTTLPQGTLTDFEFLQDLANKEKDGSYIFYISDEELHFEKIDYAKNARVTYTYGVDIVKFTPEYAESKQKGAGKSATVASFDPLEKKAATSTVTPENALDNTKLGEWDVNGNKKVDLNSIKLQAADKSKQRSSITKSGLTPQSVPAGKYDFKGITKATNAFNDKNYITPKNVQKDNFYGYQSTLFVLPTGDKTEAVNIANKVQKTAGSGTGKPKILTATLAIKGNPLLKPGDIITIAGVAKRHQGNWYINKISHDVTPSSYYGSNLEMTKNGSSKENTAGAAKSDKVNKTLGDKTTDTKKEIPSKTVYWNNDGSGKRILPNQG